MAEHARALGSRSEVNSSTCDDPWMINNTSSKPRSVSASDFRTVTSTCGNSTLRISLSDDGMTLVVERASVTGECDEDEEEDQAADDNVFIATAVVEQHEQPIDADDVELARAERAISSLGRQSLSTDAEPEEEGWQPLQRGHTCHQQRLMTDANILRDVCRQSSVYENEETESPYSCTWQWKERTHHHHLQQNDVEMLAMTSPFRRVSEGCAGRLEGDRHWSAYDCWYDVIAPGLRTDVIHGSLPDLQWGQQQEDTSQHDYYDDISQIFYHVYDSSDSELSSTSGSHLDLMRFSYVQRTTDHSNGRPSFKMKENYGTNRLGGGRGVGETMQSTCDNADTQSPLPRLSQDSCCRQTLLATPGERRRQKQAGRQQGTPVSAVITYYPTRKEAESGARQQQGTPVSGVISYNCAKWNFDSDSECAGCSSNDSTPYVIFLPKQPIQKSLLGC